MVDSYITYVLTKEDIHELTYQQAHKGGLKRSTFIILGSIFRFGYLIVFLYLTYVNYITLRYDQEFLSLSSKSGICTEVPKLYNFPQLQADTNGFWESELEYRPANSAYLFTFFDISHTMPDYTAFMKTMQFEVESVGAESTTHNLAVNLVHWCFWDYITSDHGKVRSVKFTGLPEHILNLDQVYGAISDVNHDGCSVGISSAYDFSNTHMVLDFDVAEFQNSDCADALVRNRYAYTF